MKDIQKINNLSTKLYFPSNPPKQIVVGVHGFFGDKESSVLVKLGERLVQNNSALITFDLPCHGHNDTSQILRLSDCIKSFDYIFDWVYENFPNIPISIFATSFGGYLTLLYLSKHDKILNKIILRAPAINMHHVLTDVLLPFQSLSAEDLKIAKNIGKEQSLWVDFSFIEELKINSLPNDNEKFFNEFYENKHEIIYFENADHRFKKPGELEKIIDETLKILNLKH